MDTVSPADPALALIEIVDGHGRVLSRERLELSEAGRRVTVGRSLHADIVLDDPYAAPLHAALEFDADGRVFVSDLGSTNGFVTGGRRHHGAERVPLADAGLQVGRTRLRVRTTHDALAPERAEQWRTGSVLRDPRWVAGLAAVAGVLQLTYTTWLGAPRDLMSGIVTALISATLASGVWVAFWALLSRVILGEWRWLRHAAIFLGIAVVSVAIGAVLDLAWFAFSLPTLSALAPLMSGAIVACALYLHLTNASHISARRAAVIACLVPALFGGAGYWVQARSQLRNVNYIGDELRIYPPALRLRSADSLEQFVAGAAALREAADEKRDATKQYADDAEPDFDLE